MISQFALFTCSSALALHLGSQQRLPLRTLTPQEEPTHTLRVDLGGELGAVRLHAPVSRLTRWPAGDLWPAGRALATRLSAEPGLVRGRRVLELGTGLGIAGIAAADAGARHVFLSDICVEIKFQVPRVIDAISTQATLMPRQCVSRSGRTKSSDARRAA
jgi:hypothetical protein